ncbi:hypothetical protein F889_01762 [Acinetobacter colistiniresistens]|uniref:DUF6160 domain-containing protein n=1 Tax=Acinetobacter colistiniresistens TaxID=280145 RepID=N9R779_9GAMM|nr:DUF6160 family protein [Acinetobacter colistiniresistens]ENX34480.1 hypothetical protein F889_01762 [Acinetobacter colistiniresistens]
MMNKIIGCLSLLLTPFAMAMQPLDDQSLSTATGQNGLNIGVNVSKIEFKQISVIDSDGWDIKNVAATEYRGRAGLVFAQSPNTTVSNPNIIFKAGGAASDLNLKAVIDTDKGTGTGGAFANIALSFVNVDEFVISPLSVYAASDSAGVLSTLVGSNYLRGSIFDTNPGTLKSGVKEILRLQNGLNVKFLASNKPKMNIQLGAAPQGKMIRFGGAIDSICGAGSGCNMMLVSGYDGSNNPVGASFNFQLKASNPTGFGLDKFYAGVIGESSVGQGDGALVFGNEGKSDNVDLKLNNIQFGNTAAIPAPSDAAYRFNGLQNSSIGNIGFTNASVTDLKIRVNGM